MKNLSAFKLIGAIIFAVLVIGALYEYAGGAKFFSQAEALTTCQKAVAKWEEANPEMLEAKTLFSGTPAPVNFAQSRFPTAKDYKTAIQEAVSDGPDLAGKYAVAQWGCGTSCQEHAVVNMETGEVVALGIHSEAGVSMSNHYNVLVSNPVENMPKQEDLGRAKSASLAYLLNIPREYYVILDAAGTTTFSKICTENPFEGFTL